MSREQRAVGDDDMAAQLPIVGYMSGSHEELVRSDYSIFTQAIGAVHRHVFAEDVAVPDSQSGRIVLVLQILRCIADDGTGVEPVLPSDGGMASDVGMWPDAAANAEHHVRIDDGVRAD